VRQPSSTPKFRNVILFVYDVELDKCDAKRGFPNRRMNRNKGSDGILNLEIDFLD